MHEPLSELVPDSFHRSVQLSYWLDSKREYIFHLLIEPHRELRDPFVKLYDYFYDGNFWTHGDNYWTDIINDDYAFLCAGIVLGFKKKELGYLMLDLKNGSRTELLHALVQKYPPAKVKEAFHQALDTANESTDPDCYESYIKNFMQQ